MVMVMVTVTEMVRGSSSNAHNIHTSDSVEDVSRYEKTTPLRDSDGTKSMGVPS